MSDTSYFSFKPHKITFAEFTAADGNFPIHISYRLTDSALAARRDSIRVDSAKRANKHLEDSIKQLSLDFKNILSQKETTFWAYINSSSSKAPRFFKESTFISLEDEYGTALRNSFISTLLQCRMLFRLLILAIWIYLLCGLVKRELFYNSSSNYSSMAP